MKPIGSVLFFILATITISVAPQAQNSGQAPISIQGNVPWDDLEDLCQTEDGVARILRDSLMDPGTPENHLRVMEAAGVDVDEYQLQTIQNRCRAILGLGPDGTYEFDPETAYPVVFSFQQENVTCWVSWDEDCERTQVFRVPQGYQACNLYYRWEEREAGGDHEIRPIAFFNGDRETPARFHGYEVKVWSEGSQNVLRPERGIMRVIDIELTAIRAEFDNEKRFEAGCDIPDDGSNPIDDIVIPPLP